jgi:hypothetical protein
VKLNVGMQVAGHGYKKPMVGGHSVIEAKETRITHNKAKKKHSAKHASH